MNTVVRSVSWERWPDSKLLDLRLCDLGLRLEGSGLERAVEQLHTEISDRGLRLRPHCWLAEEWFCPDGVSGIGIPFYLAHPRLARLERRMMLEVEGGTHPWRMKLLRHEAGHAIQNAFNLHRRKRWRTLFGNNAQKYPDFYRPRPTSKQYVLHLYLWYAQSHPAEDFAETFAVWLAPRSRWRQRYDGWPALRKLEYVDELMTELKGVAPKVRSRRRVDALPSIKKTLREHYAERRRHYVDNHATIYDRDLKRLFTNEPKARGKRAAAFLREHRKEVRHLVAQWTGEYEAAVDEVLRDMIQRCHELKLRVEGQKHPVLLDFAILLTVRTVQFIYSGKRRVPL